MKIPNVKVRALVPADFEQHAARLGYTVEEMLWLLAENLCVAPPGKIHVVTESAPSEQTVVYPRVPRAKREKVRAVAVVAPLEVGDKVVVHRHWTPADVQGCKPRLKRARVYCVRYTYRAPDGAQYVRLTGVACPAGDCGGETAILAAAFTRINRTASVGRKRKGGA